VSPRQCRVALVGAGSMAHEHAKAFRDVPGVQLTGVYSRTRTKAEALAKQFGIGIVADSMAELYEKSNADLVVVSVPELSANEVLKGCFQHSWTVLAEKPVGFDLADAEDILRESERKGRRAYVALNRRHYSATRRALQMLSTDHGTRFVKVQDQQDQASALAAGQPAKVVQNWMYANSIHVIDYFQIFGRGKVVRVTPVVPWNPHSPGAVVTTLAFSSGDIGLYEGIWNGPGPWAVAVSTANQRLEMRPLEQLGLQRRGERRSEPEPLDPLDVKFKAGFRRQAENAVAAALGEPSDLPTLREGVESMRLVKAIFSSTEIS